MWETLDKPPCRIQVDWLAPSASALLSGNERDCRSVAMGAQERTQSRLEEGKQKRLPRELHLGCALGWEVPP